MSNQVSSQTVQATVQTPADRVALIDQLCATRGSQYQNLKNYRKL